MIPTAWLLPQKSPSFCMTLFSASFTDLTAILPQSHDCTCYVSRRILAPPPLRLQKHADPRAHDFAHSPDLWHQPRLNNVTCAWSWRLCGFNPPTQSMNRTCAARYIRLQCADHVPHTVISKHSVSVGDRRVTPCSLVDTKVMEELLYAPSGTTL